MANYISIIKRIILGLLFGCFYTLISFSQPNKLKFQSIKHGLSNLHVRCILKDSRGFMWFGTSEGLNKYDGSDFTLYVNYVNDSNSLLNNNVNAILEDSRHNIWIGTTIGVSVYNRDSDNFSVLKSIGTNRFSYITSFYEDKTSNMWIGTSGQGIYVYSPKSDSIFRYTHCEDDPASLSSNYISKIISDNKDRIWLATHSGLDVFDTNLKKFIHFKSNDTLVNRLKSCHVKKICFDTQRNLWIGTYGNGLFKLTEQGTDWEMEHYPADNKPGSLSSNDILSLLCDKKGDLWIGTENGGLNILPQNSEEFVLCNTEDGNFQSISSNSIWSLYEDNEGIFWIGTYNQGINFIDERIEKFEIFQRNPFEQKTLVNNNVAGFTEDRNGNIWIATDGGGVSTFNIHTRKFINKIDNSLFKSRAIMDVLCDSKQRIWVATWGDGLHLFNSTGKQINNFRLEAFNRPGNVFCLLEDNEGNILAGTARNGLLIFDPVNNDFNKIVDSSSQTQLNDNAYVMELFQDSENTLWVGVSFCLISIKKLNGDRTFTAYQHTNHPKSLSSMNITHIFEDSKKNIWVGTDDGLNLLNRKNSTFTTFRKGDGLPNNTINGMLEDENDCLWISTHGGISKFNVEKHTFENYSVDDGLLSNSYNPRSCLKSSTGEFFYGNNSGFISFYPDSIKKNTFIPPVYLTDFKIFNHPAVIGAESSPLSKNISETKEITLNHEQTSFTIKFVALNYTHPSKNQYEYILEDFDNEWIYAGSKQFATYTNIDAGKYTFKVRGSNNHGIWNPKPAILKITVLPPYWKTKWAYLFYIICFILILWSFIKLLIIRSNQAEKLGLEKIHHEKSEALNKMKIQFFANVSHEFRTPLSLIMAPLKQVIEKEPLGKEVKLSLHRVYRNAYKLYGLIDELMDFTKSEEGRLKMMVQKIDFVLFSGDIFDMFAEEANRRNIRYTFRTDEEHIEVWVDKGKMEKIISNLLSNAFKYTDEYGVITLNVSKETMDNQPFAVVTITDNGSGIASENLDKVFDRFYQSPEADKKHISGTGIGLALVKSLVELHKGTIHVTSEKWNKTSFIFKIPIGFAHINKEDILNEQSYYTIKTKPADLMKEKKELIQKNGNAPLLLLVEDCSELREYLVSILDPEYKVLQAVDGAQGLIKAKDSIPDLIICDVAMPRLSGTELCSILKEDMSTSHIPIILLTSKSSTADMIDGIGKGADAYITKPFDVDHLKVTIEKTIETRRKLYQRFSQDIYLLPNEVSGNKLDREFVNQITAYIDQNASNTDITVENLASHLLMSRTHVYRKIKAITGKSASEFIRLTRLKMAVKLLESGKHNISEIAFHVGFSSPGYFTKCFKDQYGKSPSQFLKIKT